MKKCLKLVRRDTFLFRNLWKIFNSWIAKRNRHQSVIWKLKRSWGHFIKKGRRGYTYVHSFIFIFFPIGIFCVMWREFSQSFFQEQLWVDGRSSDSIISKNASQHVLRHSIVQISGCPFVVVVTNRRSATDLIIRLGVNCLLVQSELFLNIQCYCYKICYSLCSWVIFFLDVMISLSLPFERLKHFWLYLMNVYRQTFF